VLFIVKVVGRREPQRAAVHALARARDDDGRLRRIGLLYVDQGGSRSY
jgi:hypothetical protein